MEVPEPRAGGGTPRFRRETQNSTDMSARATRPRSRRGRHLPPAELDTLVESSEETEAAGPAQTPNGGADTEHPTGQCLQSSFSPGADQDRGEVPQTSAEGEAVSQGPQTEDLCPVGEFQRLQRVLCSLEEMARAWRFPAQPESRQEDSGRGGSRRSGTSSPGLELETGAGYWLREAEGLAERNECLRLALGIRDTELSRLQAEKEALEREVQELQNSLLSLEPAQHLPHGHTPRSGSGSSSPGVELGGAQDPLPLAHPLLRRLRSDPSSQLLGSRVTKPSTPKPRAMETQLEQLQGTLETLKSFNRLLSAALQGSKGRCEDLSLRLGQREAEATALGLALQCSEACEGAYGVLLTLGASLEGSQVEAAEREVQRLQAQEEAILGKGMLQVTMPSPQGSRVDKPLAQEVAAHLWDYIQRLQEQRVLLKIPADPGPALLPAASTVPPAEAMVQALLNTQPGPALPWLDKRQIQQDLAVTRETLVDQVLRLRLARQEKRGLELREAALRAQGPALRLLQDQLRGELTLLRTGQAGSSGAGSTGEEEDEEEEDEEEEEEERESRLHRPAVPRGGQGLDSSRVRQERDPEELAQQLAASLKRALDLQEQLRARQEELEQAVRKGCARRLQSGELNRDLCRAHSSLVLALHGAHRKQEEQRRKMEQQAALMEARQAKELAELEAVARALGRLRPPPLPPRPPRPPRPGETFL